MPLDFNDPIPDTVEQAIDYAVSKLSRQERDVIEQSTPAEFHHTIGMQIRNQWGLWQGSKLAQDFKNRFGLGHADDMSGIILKGVWAKVLDEEFIPQEEATRYQTYWLKLGIDPLTQEKIK